MSMVIQLDSSALNALFPEGSEARLNLTTAVVNNFVTRLGVAKLSQVDAQVKAELLLSALAVGRRGGGRGGLLCACRNSHFSLDICLGCINLDVLLGAANVKPELLLLSSLAVGGR